MKDLNGRVAVVTGGASGIGRGMAEVFAAEGMKVVLADVEAAALEKTLSEIGGGGATVVGVECDVSQQDSVDALARKALESFGAVHVLCNNAGVAGASDGKATWQTSLDTWDWVMGVNVMGVVHGLRSFVPIMLEQGESAHIVNTASMAGLMPGRGIYGVTKHAVVALSESLFTEFAGRGAAIGVSVLCPGWVNTRILESERNRHEVPREEPPENAEQLQAMRKIVEGMLKSGLDPVEVGRIVVDAIRADRFYVLTHDWKNMIEHRMQNILQDRAPTSVSSTGESWPAALKND